MSLLNLQKNKGVILLALISAFASVTFSFMGAPFLRALSVSARSAVFWTTATVLILALFAAGIADYKISETAVYVGAIWMTLGSYSELEKRGVNWRSASFFAITTGTLFALAGYFLILKNLGSGEALKELVEPLYAAIKKAVPASEMSTEGIIQLLPGILVGSLIGSLALGLIFETKVAKMFGIKRERVASGLRWLEFKAPDVVIWTTLVAALICETAQSESIYVMLCLNVLIVSITVLFFQGLTVVEFLLRYYKLSFFTRAITYILIILQLAPILVFVGFVDYWADFRKLVRKKSKITN